MSCYDVASITGRNTWDVKVAAPFTLDRQVLLLRAVERNFTSIFHADSGFQRTQHYSAAQPGT